MKVVQFLDRKNNNLDLIRVILSCIVIIGHSPILNGPSDLWADPIGYFFTFTYSGALAVKLFFFISGLVVTNSLIHKKKAIQFVVARAFRLVPALFFVLIITVFVFGPLESRFGSDYFYKLDHLKYLFNNLVFKTEYLLPGVFTNNAYRDVVNGSLWTLFYEVGCYIVLLGLFLILQNHKLYHIWKYLFLAILIDSILPSRIIFSWLNQTPDIALLPLAFSFGAFCAVYADKIEINLRVVAGTFLLVYVLKNTNYAHIALIFAACCTVVYVASNKYVLKFKPRYDISYGIYLWGFLIEQTLYHVFGHLYVGLHCLIALVIAILLGIITHVLIEKPFMDIGKNVNNVLNKWLEDKGLFGKHNKYAGQNNEGSNTLS